MFAGGIIPGLIMSTMFMAYIGIRCYIQPDMGPVLQRSEDKAKGREILIAVRDAGLAFGLIFLVRLILAGAATPTEAAAIGSVGAILIAVLYRRFNWKVLKEAGIGSMRLTAICVWILDSEPPFSPTFTC